MHTDDMPSGFYLPEFPHALPYAILPMPLLLNLFLVLYPEYSRGTRVAPKGDRFTTLLDAPTLTAFYQWVAMEARYTSTVVELAYAALRRNHPTSFPRPTPFGPAVGERK
jgi:hypothetical protein